MPEARVLMLLTDDDCEDEESFRRYSDNITEKNDVIVDRVLTIEEVAARLMSTTMHYDVAILEVALRENVFDAFKEQLDRRGVETPLMANLGGCVVYCNLPECEGKREVILRIGSTF